MREESIEPLPTGQKLAELVNNTNKIVIARVDAKGIGGKGTHFVLVTKYAKAGDI
jgi:hypothetical protein